MSKTATTVAHLLSPDAYATSADAFEDDSFDEKTLRGKSLVRCRFVHCGFKSTIFEDCTFNHSRFSDCYFRKAQFRRVSFVGCEFRDCKFDEAVFESCQLDNGEFSNCSITFRQVLPSFPRHDNVLWRLARNLRVNAQNRGEANDSRRFLLAELSASERHNFRKAFDWTDPYYGTKYKPLERVSAFGQWFVSKISSFLWGHGEMPIHVLRMSFLIVVVFACLYGWKGEFENFPQSHSWLEYLGYSFAAFASATYGNVTAANGSARFLSTVESILGLVLFGFFISALYRRISKR